MRVLMFSWEYPPHVVGGLGKHVLELLPALDGQDVEVHLVTPNWGSEMAIQAGGKGTVHAAIPPAQNGGDIHSSARNTNVELGRYAERLWSDVGGFDVVHAHDWLVAFSACDMKRVFGVPIVATVHATERGRGGGHLSGEMAGAIHSTEQWLVDEAQRVIVTSRYMAQQISEYFDAAPDKLDVIPNGVDASRFDRYGAADLEGFRRRFAGPQENIVFSVGRVEYQKGLHTLVEAVPSVLASYPQTRFVIAGRGSQLPDLRHRAQELGLTSVIEFPGFISDIDRDRLYKVADVAVFPSLYEPFGIVALEAMAAGCPVVASDVGGLKEVVRCCETGLTVYPGNAESVAWGILRVLAHPEKAKERAAEAQQWVREEYNWDRIATLTVASYERAQKGRGR